MGRVDTDFQRLQPVAFPQTLEGKRLVFRGLEAVVLGQGRRTAVTKEGENDAVACLARIGLVPEHLVEMTAGGLSGLFQAMPVDVIQPAVEGTAQTAVLAPPIAQVGAAMGTVAAEQTVAPVLGTKQDELLAHQRDRNNRPLRCQFLNERGGLPISTQHESGRRARPGVGEPLVFLCAHHLFVDAGQLDASTSCEFIAHRWRQTRVRR